MLVSFMKKSEKQYAYGASSDGTWEHVIKDSVTPEEIIALKKYQLFGTIRGLQIIDPDILDQTKRGLMKPATNPGKIACIEMASFLKRNNSKVTKLNLSGASDDTIFSLFQQVTNHLAMANFV